MKTPLTLLTLALAVGCSAPAQPDVPPPSPLEALLPRERTLVIKLKLAQDEPREESIHALMNTLEHLLPTWTDEQRKGRAAPMEDLLTLKVVPAFDEILEMFRNGPHERRLVAAWALGFSRVPDNEEGVASHHEEARQALVEAIPGAPDDVLNNVLLGLWILADEQTPLALVTEIMVAHHDPLARANATLVLTRVLTTETAPDVVDAVLVALEDEEDRVRLHAAKVAIRHPHPALTTRIEELLLEEPTPLVRAALAGALGAARSITSAPLLARLLDDPRQVVSRSAHGALVQLFGTDLGTTQEDWEPAFRR